MCSSGLFSSNDILPSIYTEQLIKFGLECLNKIEEINIKLNSTLKIRIGLNHSDILGKDRPIFDIIGNPINFTLKLTKTSIPGKIQISQNVYDLIHHLDFNIEKRGEIFKKGKIQTFTYLINPNTLLLLK